MNEPWEDGDYLYPDIGEGYEHLLIGSREWERAKQYEADQKGKDYSIHGFIAQAVRDHFDKEKTPRRIVGHDETTTGAQLHHTFINHAEIANALMSLEDSSDTDYARYVAVIVHGRTEEEVAASEGRLARDIRQSLYRARRVMARRVRDYIA